MARSRNIVRNHVNTTVMGSETPLDHVGSYYYSHSNQWEIGACIDVGTTSHRVEIRTTPECMQALAKRLVQELKMTAEDFGFTPLG